MRCLRALFPHKRRCRKHQRHVRDSAFPGVARSVTTTTTSVGASRWWDVRCRCCGCRGDGWSNADSPWVMNCRSRWVRAYWFSAGGRRMVERCSAELARRLWLGWWPSKLRFTASCAPIRPRIKYGAGPSGTFPRKRGKGPLDVRQGERSKLCSTGVVCSRPPPYQVRGRLFGHLPPQAGEGSSGSAWRKRVAAAMMAAGNEMKP